MSTPSASSRRSRPRASGYLCFLLLCAVAAFSIVTCEQQRTLNALRAEADASAILRAADAESAARTLSDALTEMRGSLGKLSAAGSRDSTVRLLGELRRLSDRAGGAAGALSLSHPDGAQLTQFLTRAGDYCDTLLGSAQGGVLPTDADGMQLRAIGTQCDALIALLGERIGSGTLPTDPITPDSFYTSTEPQGVLPQYPALQYDGKYAEQSEFAAARGLPAETVSRAEAEAIAKREFPDVQWEYAGRCDGAIACFLFTDGLGQTVSVTERGGRILSHRAEPPAAEAPASPDRAALEDAAVRFLAARGFPLMRPRLMTVNAGAVTIVLAPVQDGVVLAPDTVAVTLDPARNAAIGFDATGYYMHHGKRDLPAPALTPRDAENAVSESLALESVTLCLLGESNVRETLCYECRGTVGDRTYVVCIDAETGAERVIYELVTGETGEALR